MKLFTAFFRLIRWPNLVMIAVTQLLYFYTLLYPFYKNPAVKISFLPIHFFLMLLASLLIAAAGNIINDYFDLNIDEINKPDKKIIDKQIKRRWAIVFHIAFSLLAIFIGFYIDSQSPVFWLGFSNTICVLLLFGYSISFKKKLLVGNMLISILTAWVLLVCFFCFYRSVACLSCDVQAWQSQFQRLIRISILYAGFAFIISLIREVVKDMEDMYGDAKYGCKTIPIVWGIPAAKVFVAVWLVVLLGMIIIVQLYVLQFRWLWSLAYSIPLLIVPVIWVLQRLFKAQVSTDYHQISTAIKYIMMAGLLSMCFFTIY